VAAFCLPKNARPGSAGRWRDCRCSVAVHAVLRAVRLALRDHLMLPLRLAFVRVGITTPVKHTPRYENSRGDNPDGDEGRPIDHQRHTAGGSGGSRACRRDVRAYWTLNRLSGIFGEIIGGAAIIHWAGIRSIYDLVGCRLAGLFHISFGIGAFGGIVLLTTCTISAAPTPTIPHKSAIG